MSQRLVAFAIIASCALFTTEASAQRLGRRHVQYSNSHAHNHVHTHAVSQPVIESTPVAATQPAAATTAVTTYYPSTAAANAPAVVSATANVETPATATAEPKVAAEVAPTLAPPAPVVVQNVAAVMMLERNNQIRASRGMHAMRLSERLTNAAQHHASYMARTGQFSHYANGSPQSRANMFGFGGGVRENIAMGRNSVSGTFQDWTNSSGHYTNMMSHHSAAGFGYAVNSSGQGYWVAMYGDE